MRSNKPLMPSDRLDALMRLVFEELIRRGGTGHGRDVLAAVARVAGLSDVELALNSHAIPRWETNIRFHTTDCVRAGFLQKQKGHWSLTEEGRNALQLPPGEMIRKAQRMYREWAATQPMELLDANGIEILTADAESSTAESTLTVNAMEARRQTFERAEEDAQEGIEQHLHRLNPYEFQTLTGELLTAMKYHVAHNAPRGPDGGIDLIVYKDPLGTVTPRIKVQVKHRPSAKVSVKEIRELQGLLHADEVGLMVSTGGFTSDAERSARGSGKHVDMIDLRRFVELWVKHYPSMTEEGRAMMPLAPVFYLVPSDD